MKTILSALVALSVIASASSLAGLMGIGSAH
jgi:hypothetical protein